MIISVTRRIEEMATMTTATTQTGLTVRTFLLGDDTEDDLAVLRQALSDHGVISQCGGELARLTQEAREAANDSLASVTAGLLDLDLGDVLIYGWRTHERLVNAAKLTVRVPGREEVVQLGSHQVAWTKHPTIDLLVDGVRVHTFRFKLTITFEVDVAAAVVREGKLVALKAGDGSVIGALTLEMPGEDTQLLRQERKINFHLIVHLGSGIPLLGPRPEHVDATEQMAAAKLSEKPSSDSHR
jgi:hypothetical protein